jgi:hypothetical protein
MYEYAQILDGRVHQRFQDDMSLEELGRVKYAIGTGPYKIQVVDVTGRDPLPEEGWLYVDGQFVVPTEPEPTPEEIQRGLVAAVQRHMDTQARARGYDSIFTACTYVDDDDPVFAAEGLAYKKWRSAVWRFCYAWLADVQAGTRPVPTAEELIAELPALALPEVP